MTRIFLIAVVCTTTVAVSPAKDDPTSQSFSIECWVQTKVSDPDFPALITDKDWDGGEVEDYTSHHNYGSSRTTGGACGFALALLPTGAWSWNVGDGKSRRDYRPTASRQRIDDGELHQLAFCFDHNRNECHLYYDGSPVAIYCCSGMGSTESGMPVKIGDRFNAEQVTFQRWGRALSRSEINKLWRKRTATDTPAAPIEPTAVRSIKVMAWNIWHGGRRDGNEVGLRKTVETIRGCGADIVLMQETYGSGAEIADALGFHFYLRSTNLSVMSRYPILETYDLYQSFRLGGALVETSPGQTIKVFSLWINHLPSIGKAMASEVVTSASLIAAENETRGREIRGILKALAPHTRSAQTTPMIVAGDFNSPSHLDWTSVTADRHRGLTVDWPVSLAMADAGFVDSFRQCHPNPAKVVGRTWSPRFTDSYSMRIDYVYYCGNLQAVDSRMLDSHALGWPSDHAAVISTLRWKK